MTELAHVEIHAVDDVVVAAIAGQIDLSNFAGLEREIVASVPSTARGLVVDLSAVTYLDSTGIRLMLGLSSRARRRDQLAVAVAPIGSRVRRVMLIAGAEDAIALEPTPEAARNRVVSQASAEP